MKNNHKTGKYDRAYIGPFEVIEITGPNSVKLKNKNKIIRAHKDQLKKYFQDQINDNNSESAEDI